MESSGDRARFGGQSVGAGSLVAEENYFLGYTFTDRSHSSRVVQSIMDLCLQVRNLNSTFSDSSHPISSKLIRGEGSLPSGLHLQWGLKRRQGERMWVIKERLIEKGPRNHICSIHLKSVSQCSISFGGMMTLTVPPSYIPVSSGRPVCWRDGEGGGEGF